MNFRKETIDAFGPGYEPPNYELWLNKSCWDIKEICYLANGFNPAYIPGGMLIDLSSGEIEPAPINYGAVVLAVELVDVVKRGIESGKLMPGIVGGKCFEPLAVITYLNQKGVALPGELLAALSKSLELEKRGFPLEIVEELDSQLETISAPRETAIAAPAKTKGGRPRITHRKAELLQNIIKEFETAADTEFDYASLPGNIGDFLDACQRIEGAVQANTQVFSNATEGMMRAWLKVGGFGFKVGRPPKDETHLWTRLGVKTLAKTTHEVFSHYFVKSSL